MALLEVQNLHTQIKLKRSVVQAVDGISFTVEAGETIGIVGESGSGKTMTAMSIMRLLPNGGSSPDGSIFLDGRDLLQLDEDQMAKVRGNDVGMIFQDPMTSLNPTMTIGKQIAESVRIHRGASKAEGHDRAIEVLSLVGMPSPAQRARDYPHQLSGGMRQRAMIAIALANEPKLLIADEPTTALDVTVQKQILELIDGLRERLGMAVILVTHDLGVIAGRADRVNVMYAGRIVETTTTERLYSNPRHPYTEALFDSLPERGADSGTRLYSIPGMPPDLTRPPAACRFAARCRYAQDDCRAQDPPSRVDEVGHEFACFHPVGAAERSSQEAVVTLTDRTTAEVLPSAELGEVLLEVTDLVKDFPITKGFLRRQIGSVSAVAGVSFSIRKGETVGLVGESGCGKTTVAKLIAGLEDTTSGSMQLGGADLAALKPGERRKYSRDVQLMFQDSYAAMDPRMRVRTVVREPLDIQKVGDKESRDARIQELFEQVGLPASALERYPHEFSGGQRQRVGFARALAPAPRLIVADEPVSALDVSIQSQVLNLMKDVQAEHGLSYLFISHDLSVVRYVSDRIGVMYLGKLVEIGPAESVYSRPVHHYTRGLLDTIPVADPETEKAKARSGIVGELPSAINPPSGCRFRTRCPAAQEICGQSEPPLVPYGSDGHQAACHFPIWE
ncbi:oligopeptide/dipeptide ABC transporter, ATPase subunit [Catenulispora acidiphila DSM 44928]|uniref:Oligopeptide/dipeptide ABC transporter, ATPase subunit n=1 Tax=Catenulispora acidiphila (strain DSM 44928 / JCM 14897 / NBRC 102108 / NRRL B-24433 / ID139908) TaxID=479433 RepID=C7QKP2_CATAD|nr:ABC transporter ATP-binding protein [Catenulispora acidiphila]ACU77141.1 oligopeptide/dipeptide ABC transporter, ATPase subunit [Catenulispora acidiphila DSM 44928]